MAIEWLRLRTWNGSQQTAFERLAVLLLSREKPSSGGLFVPKGAPDAGVEAYWKLVDGGEWGIQAKFFLTALSKKQWQQLDESVKTAIERHPNLARLTIAIPQDKSDPKVSKQSWFEDKWQERVERWSQLAAPRNVKFEYWGETELLDRLSRDENRGLTLFWFDEKVVDINWLKGRVEETVRNLGPRYTPTVHVELPIAFVFEGLGLTDVFVSRVKEFRIRIKRLFKKTGWGPARKEVPHALSNIDKSVVVVADALLAHLEERASKPSFEQLAEAADQARTDLWSGIGEIKRFEQEKFEKLSEGQKPAPDRDLVRSMFDQELYMLRELAGALYELEEFARSHAAQASETRSLIISGGAGTGKTHLFCDVALRRLNNGLPTLLLTGTQFSDSEPLPQMVGQILGLQTSRDDFLAALDAAGEANGTRTLVLIDAINEGDGKLLWKKYLNGMLGAFRKYKNIAVGLSVRDTYESLVLPEEDDPPLVKVRHPGFQGEEYSATRTFFNHYGLRAPAIPVLDPEFDNPLFLKLFCKSLVNSGVRDVPTGFHGLSTIFNGFLQSVNQKLAHPQSLDYDESEQLVHRAVHVLIDAMAASQRVSIECKQAREAVNALRPSDRNSRSLYKHLLAEDVIYEDRSFDPASNAWVELTKFSFERFTDHLIAKRLLDSITTKDMLLESIHTGSLAPFFADEWSARRNAGLIEALTIQVPERFKTELIELCQRELRTLSQAFLKTIAWRTSESFTAKTLNVLNDLVSSFDISDRDVYRVLLLVGVNPQHPWNSDFLHKNLMRRSLTERDASWSVFVFEERGQETSLDRLVNWALEEKTPDRFEEESLRLAGLSLGWLLSTSNRFARDTATKAIVSLFASRPEVLAKVVLAFSGVNDPYVVERLMCAAYGVALRTSNATSLAPLVEAVFNTVFEKGNTIPHILTRDYARGVVELAVRSNCKISFDPDKARPPYRSRWQEPEFEEGELEAWSERTENMSPADWAKRHIYYSVMGSGDFARYVIGTNSGSFEWSRHRISKKRKKKERFEYGKDDFDLRIAQRWIMRRVIDLGWDSKLLGDFDAGITRYSRQEHKSERIGKKYQWIAYHELLAHVADNFEFVGDRWSDKNEKYEGPWQIMALRDIDPSVLVSKTAQDSDNQCWWQPLKYRWKIGQTDGQWLSTTGDIPNIAAALLIKDSFGREWYVLENHFSLNEPKTLEEEEESESTLPRRQIWFQIRSYLVKKSDFNKSFRWAKQQDFMGRWMPEVHPPHGPFLREYYWSRAYQYFQHPYYDRYQWIASSRHDSDGLPAPVLLTTDEYRWEKGFDCSIQNTISCMLPCLALVDGLSLHPCETLGQFSDPRGNVVAQDPSTQSAGPSALLVERGSLEKFLADQNLAMIWTVLGEKRIFVDDRDNWPGRLDISGAYAPLNGKVAGDLNFKRIDGRSL